MLLLHNIEKLFEEFTVHHEPVKSALLAAVTGVVKDIWDLDPRMSKYKNKTFTDVQTKFSTPGSFQQLKNQAKAAEGNLPTAKRAKSNSVEDLHAAGVKNKIGAMLLTLGEVEHKKAIEIIEQVIKAALIIAVDVKKPTDRDKAAELIKQIKRIANIYHVDEHEICALMFELGDPDSGFEGVIAIASEKGSEGIAAKIKKETPKIGE